MANKKKKKDELRSAFESTASKVSTLGKGLGDGLVQRLALLATMRLVLLRKLSDMGYVEGSGVSEWFDGAKRMGCPLFDPGLDSTGVDPLDAVTVASAPDHIADPATVFEGLGDLELSRKKKGKKYKTTFKPDARRRKGSFFTPVWMAERLVAMAFGEVLGQRSSEEIWSLRVVDPACGDGRLLAKSMEVILGALGVEEQVRPDACRRMVKDCIRGVELDPVCAALARTNLWLGCDPRMGKVDGLEQAIVTGDSLLGPLDRIERPGIGWKVSFGQVFERAEPGFDVLVANPPFEVLTGFAKRKGLKSYAQKIRKSGYDLALYGNLNTYKLFLERSIELLADGGRMGLVLPFGFMMDRTASKLRSHIIRKGWMEQVEVYPESARTFEGVGQSVVLLGIHKGSGSSSSIVLKDGANEQMLGSVTLEQLSVLDPDELVLPPVRASSISLAARMSSVCSSCVGEIADGMVGELDQTKFRKCMESKETSTLLVRGTHMKPYHVNLEADDEKQRWVDKDRFESERATGRWRKDIEEPRLVQTGIVNMEASRRLVAAIVPAGVVLGNSVNYWVPKKGFILPPDDARWYLLAFLNSTPAEWRFRLSSSNNNINLYEVKSLPLPGLVEVFPAERAESYLKKIIEQVQIASVHPLGMVRQITAGWGAPGHSDKVVAMLLGRVAKLIEDEVVDVRRRAWLEHLLDHLVNWHLGLDEPDLDYMLEEVPARAWKS